MKIITKYSGYALWLALIMLFLLSAIVVYMMEATWHGQQMCDDLFLQLRMYYTHSRLRKDDSRLGKKEVGNV